MTIECSLCHTEFNDKDEVWLIQKSKHEEWHEKGREDGINRIKGMVTWITKW